MVGYGVVCTVNMSAIVTMQANDDVCVQYVCTWLRVGLIAICACVFGHVVESCVHTV